MHRVRAHRCRTCSVEFYSRNRLFEHLREEGHHDQERRYMAPAVTQPPRARVYEHTAYVLPTIEDPTPAPEIERVELSEDGRAFVLRNVLSPAECKGYIEAAAALGMQSVQVNGYERRVRVCSRVAAASEVLAGRLFDRIAPFLSPIDLTDPCLSSRPAGIPADRRRTFWRPHGLNELFRICKYDPGGHFAPHLDGGHVRSGTDCSMQTVMLYLNEEYEGGHTRFFDDSQAAYREPDPAKVVCTYVPRRGDALIFHSELMHDGEALRRGQKWILRSEVMYKVRDVQK
eukprot:4866646-Prymnesium_polylepis.1